jgi:hypothetical protein
MALFSRRFWHALIAHDRRLVAASSGYEQAVRRLRTSRKCMTEEAQVEFRVELMEALQELRTAVGELRAFQNRHSLRDTP